jgi:hypothetical protein
VAIRPASPCAGADDHEHDGGVLAPSVASDNAKQFASLARRTGRPIAGDPRQRSANQPRGVGVLNQSCGGRDRPGMPMPTLPIADGGFDRGDEFDDRAHRRAVTAARCGDAASLSSRPSSASASPSILVPPRSPIHGLLNARDAAKIVDRGRQRRALFLGDDIRAIHRSLPADSQSRPSSGPSPARVWRAGGSALVAGPARRSSWQARLLRHQRQFAGSDAGFDRHIRSGATVIACAASSFFPRSATRARP